MCHIINEVASLEYQRVGFSWSIRVVLVSDALRPAALAAREAGYGTPQPMRDYLYIKASQKEPFDELYWSAGGRDTDFGERPNAWRVELRVRYFF